MNCVESKSLLSRRLDESAVWQTVSYQDQFVCASGSTIRTPAGTLCELTTTSGCRIRMNGDAELAFLADDRIELRAGQVWCSAPTSASMDVVAGQLAEDSSQTAITLDENASCVFSCPHESVGDSNDRIGLRIESDAGRVRVTSSGRSLDLEPGRSATIGRDDVRLSPETVSASRRMKWMRPLLIRKGHNNPELIAYVNSVLAGVGQAKVSYLSESEIRSLGEYGALPLLRFVESDDGGMFPHKRQRAAAILANISPVWMIPDLIPLLNDDDTAVVESTRQALTRLTGVRGSRPLSPDADQANWRAWWERNGGDCPGPLFAHRD